MSSGPHKSLFYIGFTHPQGGHPLGELLFLFWIYRKRRHGRSLTERIENLKERVKCNHRAAGSVISIATMLTMNYSRLEEKMLRITHHPAAYV